MHCYLHCIFWEKLKNWHPVFLYWIWCFHHFLVTIVAFLDLSLVMSGEEALSPCLFVCVFSMKGPRPPTEQTAPCPVWLLASRYHLSGSWHYWLLLFSLCTISTSCTVTVNHEPGCVCVCVYLYLNSTPEQQQEQLLDLSQALFWKQRNTTSFKSSRNVSFVCTPVEQKHFDAIKKIP